MYNTACGGSLTAEHGQFTSPRYPDPYVANVECVWNISVSPGNRIMLAFRYCRLTTTVSSRAETPKQATSASHWLKAPTPRPLAPANYRPPNLHHLKLLPYTLFEKYIYNLALEMASPGNQHCASCTGTLYRHTFVPRILLSSPVTGHLICIIAFGSSAR